MTDHETPGIATQPATSNLEIPAPPLGKSHAAITTNQFLVPAAQELQPQGCACNGGGGGGAMTPGYVYSIGTITARFPNQSVEREFIQAWGRPNYGGPISDAVKYEVLSQGQNLYLAREMCWTLQNESVDLYLLQPRAYSELTDLILALAPEAPGQIMYDLVIGARGPIAPPEMCNGAQLPMVATTQIFSFTQEAFINQIVSYSETIKKPVTKETALNAFSILIQLKDNAGQSDEDRAINYLTFKSMIIYVFEGEMEKDNFLLTAVTAQPSRLGGPRRIVDVIFSYTSNLTTEVRRFFTRVDVTGQFPFLVTEFQRFFERP
jgi:hypothetical protein